MLRRGLHPVVGGVRHIELHATADFLQGQAAGVVEARQRRVQLILPLRRSDGGGEREGWGGDILVCCAIAGNGRMGEWDDYENSSHRSFPHYLLSARQSLG